MKILDVLNAPEKENPHGVSVRPAHVSPHAAVMHITLKPGETLKRHITPVDVFFYVLDGRGSVEIGDEREEVGRDMLIESPAGIPHRLFNDTDTTFRVLVVKTPNPTSSTRML
ncbi:MAG TPA: cupin domain-containing protein [Myxococcota bacterium]|nr:cupin domain-containing protein [Myxococcota bacterium]HOD08435.1 cupin domain-containing protein [Myxococcota bacterium]HPB51073.1 cupin domain-containing protein [Myxococcota bacterium]HQP96299.1 cupin domain-containing protein [Myxococcota bacterium]